MTVMPTSSGSTLSIEVRRALGPILSLYEREAFSGAGLRDLLVQVRDGRGEVWADRDGTLHRVPEIELSPIDVRSVAVNLIGAGGRRLDELHPCADVHIGDGVRVHAVLPPVSVHGAAVSIRLPHRQQIDFETLVMRGLCDAHTADRLRTAVQQRENMLITGGTGSGKTTLLGSLLSRASPHERIVTIEDVAELRPAHPHHIALEARPANAEGAGEVSVDRLLREALRMRPDRIVLGECRGPEIATLLTALNTGHDGGAGTLHANQLDDVPARLEALGLLAGYSPETLARQAVSALHLVVHVERNATLGHRIVAIGQLELAGDRLSISV